MPLLLLLLRSCRAAGMRLGGPGLSAGCHPILRKASPTTPHSSTWSSHSTPPALTLRTPYYPLQQRACCAVRAPAPASSCHRVYRNRSISCLPRSKPGPHSRCTTTCGGPAAGSTCCEHTKMMRAATTRAASTTQALGMLQRHCQGGRQTRWALPTVWGWGGDFPLLLGLSRMSQCSLGRSPGVLAPGPLGGSGSAAPCD